MTTITYERIQDMIDVLRQRSSLRPRVAILLGTGLGALAERIVVSETIAQAEVPGMPVSTAESHAGSILFGTLSGVPVVAFSGRLHAYEGYSTAEVTLPVRLGKALGAEVLVMGSAVGGLDPRLHCGQVVVIDDHINLMGVNPLVGPNDDRLGPRWPDMSAPYDETLLRQAEAAALTDGWALSRVVYAGVLGPNLETRAEYRMLRALGADVVGMSTIPEVIAAVHAGMRTLALAAITDLCLPDALETADISRIIAAAGQAEPLLSAVVERVVAGL